jgi:hypothetical protein
MLFLAACPAGSCVHRHVAVGRDLVRQVARTLRPQRQRLGQRRGLVDDYLSGPRVDQVRDELGELGRLLEL